MPRRSILQRLARRLAAGIYGRRSKIAAPMPPPDPATLLPSLAIFAQPDFSFGAWQGGRRTDGVIEAAFFAFSPGAQDFVEGAYAGHWVRPEIIWSDWATGSDYRRFRTDPDALRDAGANEIAHLLTTLIRGDRFNEGLLAAAFDDGLLHRILERVAALPVAVDGSKRIGGVSGR